MARAAYRSMPARFGQGRWRSVAIGLNVAIRAMMVFFAADALLAPPDDPRFEDKGIGPRSLLIVFGYSIVIPAIHLLRRGTWSSYPWWTDSLYLSVPWLDMAGNHLDLYETYFAFDLVPHTHGPGALTVVLMEAARMSFPGAVAIVQIGHILLEAQEFYGDLILGTENVRGIFDVVNDLLVGVVGSLWYAMIYHRLRRGRWWPGWR